MRVCICALRHFSYLFALFISWRCFRFWQRQTPTLLLLLSLLLLVLLLFAFVTKINALALICRLQFASGQFAPFSSPPPPPPLSLFNTFRSPFSTLHFCLLLQSENSSEMQMFDNELFPNCCCWYCCCCCCCRCCCCCYDCCSLCRLSQHRELN